MAVVDFHILAQALLYIAVLVTGFTIAIPIGVVRVGICFYLTSFIIRMMHFSDKNVILVVLTKKVIIN